MWAPRFDCAPAWRRAIVTEPSTLLVEHPAVNLTPQEMASVGRRRGARVEVRGLAVVVLSATPDLGSRVRRADADPERRDRGADRRETRGAGANIRTLCTADPDRLTDPRSD